MDDYALRPPRNRHYSLSGFTRIELLMVMMLLAVLGATALPQFLDFRSEGRLAAARQIIQAVRVGIKLQQQEQQIVLRCSTKTLLQLSKSLNCTKA